MKRFILGVILGCIFTAGVCYGYRIPKPQRITGFDHNGLIILNAALEQLYDLTNGRFSLNVSLVNPDGNLNGNVGEILLFNNSGTFYLCINTTGAKVWRSVVLTDTP